MNLTPIINQDDLYVGYDADERWLYADWLGEHTLASAQVACLRVLHCLHHQPCTKLLNDFSNCTRLDVMLPDWGQHWLAGLRDGGLRYLAWVFPPDFALRQQADKLLLVPEPVVAAFDDLASACEWLRRQELGPHRADRVG